MAIDITHVVTFRGRESFLEKVVQTLYDILDLAFIKKANFNELKSNIENWISAWDSSVEWDNEGNDGERQEWVESIVERLTIMRKAIMDTQLVFAADNVLDAADKLVSAKIKFDET